MAVVVAGALEGAVAGTDGRTIGLEAATDRELADLVLEALHDAGVPTVGVSYGGNRIDEAAMPMDWGTLIPLWHLGGRATPPLPAVVVSPARDLSPEAHVDAGRAIAPPLAAPIAASSSWRAPITATATTRTGRTATTLHPPSTTARSPRSWRQPSRGAARPRAGVVERAAADSWWQLLMLHGALGDGWQAELLSYEAPTYYGMLCAAFTPS